MTEPLLWKVRISQRSKTISQRYMNVS